MPLGPDLSQQAHAILARVSGSGNPGLRAHDISLATRTGLGRGGFDGALGKEGFSLPAGQCAAQGQAQS